VPAPAERANYGPWTADRPWYLPSQSVGGPYLAPVQPQSEVVANNTIPEATNNLVQPQPEVNISLKNIVATLESKVAALEERLLATATVAAHTALFKQRIEALEALAQRPPPITIPPFVDTETL
jgi:hypothetical protein